MAVMSNDQVTNYGLSTSSEVLLTSEAGDKLASKNNVHFKSGDSANNNIIRVQPHILKQTLLGIGSSFTESSAFVLAHLDIEKRAEVMKNIFSEEGANFSISRTPIGATDFSVEGKYSYADVADDFELKHFSIAPDQDGFSVEKYPGIKDERFDLLPMIKQAIEIKQSQRDTDLKFVASAWTAPPWMKDIGDWYQNGFPSSQ